MGPSYALSTLLHGGISFDLALFEAVQAHSMQCTLHDIYLTTQISFEGKVCKLFASMIDFLNSSLSRCLSKCWLHADKFDHKESKTCESGFQQNLLVSLTALETGNKFKVKTALWNKMHAPEIFFFFDQPNVVLRSQNLVGSILQISLPCTTEKALFFHQSCVQHIYTGT